MNTPQQPTRPNGPSPSPVPNQPQRQPASAPVGGGSTAGGVRETVGHAWEATTEKASQVGQAISQRAASAYEGAKDAGHKVEEWAEDAYDTTARHAGHYADEVTTLIKNHPLPAVLIGFGIGYLLGRAVR